MVVDFLLDKESKWDINLDVVVVVVTNKQSMYLQHFVYLATKRLLFQSYSHRPQASREHHQHGPEG